MASTQEPATDLLAPGLLGPLPPNVASLPEVSPEAPRLLRLLAKANRRRFTPDDPYAMAAARLGLSEPVAAGPLGAYGLGEAVGDAYWLRVDPLHIRPDRDRLMVFGPASFAVSADECRAIAEAVNDLIREDGLEMIPAGDHWYMRADTAPQLQTAPIHRVSGRYMEAYLPEGADARQWTALLNELQMLLHGLEVNRAREAARQATVNGLWPWGGGCLPAPGDTSIERVVSADPVIRGMGAVSGAEVVPIEATAAELDRAVRQLLHVEDPWRALISGDVGEWMGAVEAFEGEWGSALEATARCRPVELMPGNGWRYQLRRGQHRRFWRRLGSLRRHVSALPPRSQE